MLRVPHSIWLFTKNLINCHTGTNKSHDTGKAVEDTARHSESLGLMDISIAAKTPNLLSPRS
jgi:hypothetical protein